MSEASQFVLSDGSVVVIESSPQPEVAIAGEEAVGLGDYAYRYFRRESPEKPAKLEEKVEPAIRTLQAIRQSLSKSASDADEVVIQAGLKIVGEAGVVIGKVGSEANFSITLKWCK